MCIRDRDTGDIPLIADISSCFLSEPIDVTKFDMLYGGAQKNVAPAGLTMCIIREDMLGNARDITPTMLNYKDVYKRQGECLCPKRNFIRRMIPAPKNAAFVACCSNGLKHIRTGNRIVTDRVDADKVEDLVALFKKHKPDIVVNVALPYQDLTKKVKMTTM